ncbi:ABC-type molybdate transport system permease subunit [Bradyrhizobium sp. JR3.5]
MASALKDGSQRGGSDDDRAAAGATADGTRFLCTRAARLGRTGGLLASFWGERVLAFTFAGIVVGSVLSALRLVVQPIRNAFAAIDGRPLETARRVSPFYAFITIGLPLARLEFVEATVLGFAHTIGTFGS